MSNWDVKPDFYSDLSDRVVLIAMTVVGNIIIFEVFLKLAAKVSKTLYVFNRPIIDNKVTAALIVSSHGLCFSFVGINSHMINLSCTLFRFEEIKSIALA